MAGIADLERVLARLEEATETCRQVTRDAHAATKDLRQVVKEAGHLLDGAVGERIDAGVKVGLDEYTSSIKEAIDGATASVYRRFDSIEQILMGEEPGDPGPSVEVLIRARAAIQAEIDKRGG